MLAFTLTEPFDPAEHGWTQCADGGMAERTQLWKRRQGPRSCLESLVLFSDVEEGCIIAYLMTDRRGPRMTHEQFLQAIA